MFHIFGWEREQQNNNNLIVPDPLINQSYKRQHSRKQYEKQSLQNRIDKTRKIHTHQVIN